MGWVQIFALFRPDIQHSVRSEKNMLHKIKTRFSDTDMLGLEQEVDIRQIKSGSFSYYIGILSSL